MKCNYNSQLYNSLKQPIKCLNPDQEQLAVLFIIQYA